MTAALSDPRPENRVMLFIGHYTYLGVFIWAALAVLSDVTANRIPGLPWVVLGAWVSWLLSDMFISDRYHRHHLCERCIAGTPLDPQASVTRWKQALKVHHERGRRIVVLFALLALDLGVGFTHSWTWYIINAALILALTFFVTADQVHRRLYPWCPYCHWGDGGHHEFVPDPDPAMSKS